MGFARVMGGGRGNLRVAKTPPLQSALRGDRCGYAAPIAICAHGGINGNGEWEDHDAARRVATSSEKRENLFETAVFQKGNRGERAVGGNLLCFFPSCT